MIINVQKKDTIMKKTYISPSILIVELRTNRPVLIGASNTHAASDAEVFARDLDIDEDDF